MSLIASVLKLDRAAVKALRITDPYSLHRVVYSLFADVRSDDDKVRSTPSGIQFADQGGNFEGRKILLLSNRAPAECLEGGHGEVSSRPVPQGFLDHDRFCFKVIINPTRRDGASGKLHPVKGREAIAGWFAERSPASWGFQVSLQHLQVDRVSVLQFKDKAQRPVSLAQAHVQGQLRVLNPAQFKSSFSRGIGRGRSFGCGLMQIVPLIDRPFS